MAVFFLLSILPLTLSKEADATHVGIKNLTAIPATVQRGTLINVSFSYDIFWGQGLQFTNGWQIRLDGTTILASGTNFHPSGLNPTFGTLGFWLR